MRFHFTKFFLVVSALLACASAGRADPPSTAWREVIAPDEPAKFAAAAEAVNQLQLQHSSKSDGVLRRGFHAKMHAGLSGEFRTLEVPEVARYGIFKTARTYPCWVRFSNGIGSVNGDRKPDARGYAIKVVGAEGPMLIPGEEDAHTQDFLGINTPDVVARNTAQFLVFARASMDQLHFLPILVKELGLKESARIAGYVAGRLVRPVLSLATESYWSGGVIKLGPYAAKYIMKPAAAAPHGFHLFGPHDYLRDELDKRLEAGDVRFDFYLQFFVDEQRTPIEDASVEWDEKASPPVKVAELVLRKRDMHAPLAQAEEKFVDGLAFTPWHAPADLRPVGDIQRSRLVVYKASAKLRGQTRREPDGSEHVE